jgi:glycosyltransferase involved in cell wall biosynthesis/predicted metal-dependent phosphoesterase TrpH
MHEISSSDLHVRRADMHVHSTASELSKLGIQRSLQLPECATEPEEVYELAKRRGMDFVTITDHDTIAGALKIAHLPGVFVSEELTTWFKAEPQAVHVLCYGITPDDHEWLQSHNDSVEECAEYLQERQITAALAHPFYAVEAPLTPRHRRRLAQLFPIWETRNGSRAKELNLPAFVYIETHGGTGIGGTDDHAGIDIGRTFTQTPAADDPLEFLAHIRAGDAISHGDQGGAAKWTHAAMALAIRSLGQSDVRAGRHQPDRAGGCGEDAGRPDPAAVLRIVQRVMSEGDARSGQTQRDLGPQDALALLRSWLEGMRLDVDEQRLIGYLQDGEIGHQDLYRRARRIHERELARVVTDAVSLIEQGRLSDLGTTSSELFDACLPAIPYAAATAFLGREKLKLSRADGDQSRVAIVADGLGGMHGVTHTIQQIRDRGVPGFEVEVIGTDADVDRRLTAVAEVDIPFYEGLRIAVPSIPAITDAICEGRYDLIHVCSPGPAGIAAWGIAKLMELPLLGSYHTELAAYAGLRSGMSQIETLVDFALGGFYGACDVVLSPSSASDERLERIGVEPSIIGRWDRGVDLNRFDPGLRDEALLPGEVNVLYAGRLTKEKGVELLADAFLEARATDPRLHLVLAGGGPEQQILCRRLGPDATFLGWQYGDELARTYASADAFLLASRTDTFGQVVLEAQASGLPVVAVAEGGPATLIEHGETGLLTAADSQALAGALRQVLDSPMLAQRLRRAALTAVSGRTWEAAIGRLADGYDRALFVAEAAGPASPERENPVITRAL